MLYNTKNAYSTYLARSASEVDAETRAMIDKAVAEGKVTKVSTGKTAAEATYRWDGYKLVVAEGPGFKELKSQLFRSGRGKADAVRQAAKAQAQARVAAITEQVRSGMTVDQIVELRVSFGEGRDSVRRIAMAAVRAIAEEKARSSLG